MTYLVLVKDDLFKRHFSTYKVCSSMVTAELLDAMKDMKRVNPHIQWPVMSDEDQVPLRKYQGDGTYSRK